MTRPAGMHTNFAWAVVSNGVFALLQWGAFWIITRLGDKALAGQYALGLALSTPVMLFTSLQLRSALVTDSTREFPFRSYLHLRVLSVPISILMIGLAVVALDYPQTTSLVILAIAFAKSVEAVTDIVHGLYQRSEQMRLAAYSFMLRTPIGLASLALVLWATGSVYKSVLATAMTQLIILLTFDTPKAVVLLRKDLIAQQKQTSSSQWWLLRWSSIRSLFSVARLALPLSITAVLISLNMNLPIYLTEYHLGITQTGLFAAMQHLILGMSMFIMAIGQAASPRLSDHMANGNHHAFNALLTKLLAIAAAIGAASLLFIYVYGESLLLIVYGNQYISHVDVLVVMAFGGALLYIGMLLGFGITATRDYDFFPIPYAVVTCCTLICCAVLIPMYGMMGAGLGFLSVGAGSCLAPIVVFYQQSLKRSKSIAVTSR